MGKGLALQVWRSNQYEQARNWYISADDSRCALGQLLDGFCFQLKDEGAYATDARASEIAAYPEFKKSFGFTSRPHNCPIERKTPSFDGSRKCWARENGTGMVMHLNDDHGYSSEQIAEFAEKNPGLIFVKKGKYVQVSKS